MEKRGVTACYGTHLPSISNIKAVMNAHVAAYATTSEPSDTWLVSGPAHLAYRRDKDALICIKHLL